VLAWLSVWSEVQTWYRLTRVVPDIGPLNGCVCVCVCVCVVYQVVVVCCGFVERELVACAVLWRVAVTCARLTSQAVNTSATHSGTAVNVTCDVIAPVPRSPLAFRTPRWPLYVVTVIGCDVISGCVCDVNTRLVTSSSGSRDVIGGRVTSSLRMRRRM